MTRNEIRDALSSCVRHVFEIACFAQPMAIADPVRVEGDDVIAASVRFCGSRAGSVELRADTDAAHALASSFLGRMHAIGGETTEPIQDSICELGNIVCGRLISLLDPEASVTIGPPQTGAGEKSEDWVEQSFRLESGNLAVAVRFA